MKNKAPANQPALLCWACSLFKRTQVALDHGLNFAKGIVLALKNQKPCWFFTGYHQRRALYWKHYQSCRNNFAFNYFVEVLFFILFFGFFFERFWRLIC
jgi:hypothetical protein